MNMNMHTHIIYVCLCIYIIYMPCIQYTAILNYLFYDFAGSGKCIGRKNMLAFKFFIGFLNLQCYLLAAALVYFIVAPSNGWPTKLT